MCKNTTSLFLILLFCFLSCFAFAQKRSKLDRAKDTFNTNYQTEEGADTDTTASYTSSSSSGGGGSWLGSFIFDAVLFPVVEYTFLLIFIDTPSDTYEDPTTFLSPYPYFDGYSGNYHKDPENAQKSRLALSDHYFTNGKDLFGNVLEAEFMLNRRLALVVDYLYLLEDVGTDYDDLTRLNFKIRYNRVYTEKFNMHWEMGVQYYASTIDQAAFNVGLGMDYFIKNPWSISLDANWSFRNENTDPTYSFFLKHHKNKWHFDVGMYHVGIGDFSLTAPSVGLGYCF